ASTVPGISDRDCEATAAAAALERTRRSAAARRGVSAAATAAPASAIEAGTDGVDGRVGNPRSVPCSAASLPDASIGEAAESCVPTAAALSTAAGVTVATPASGDG